MSLFFCSKMIQPRENEKERERERNVRFAFCLEIRVSLFCPLSFGKVRLEEQNFLFFPVRPPSKLSSNYNSTVAEKNYSPDLDTNYHPNGFEMNREDCSAVHSCYSCPTDPNRDEIVLADGRRSSDFLLASCRQNSKDPCSSDDRTNCSSTDSERVEEVEDEDR